MENVTNLVLLPGLAGVIQTWVLAGVLVVFFLGKALELRNAWVTRPIRSKPRSDSRPCRDSTDPAETPATASGATVE